MLMLLMTIVLYAVLIISLFLSLYHLGVTSEKIKILKLLIKMIDGDKEQLVASVSGLPIEERESTLRHFEGRMVVYKRLSKSMENE